MSGVSTTESASRRAVFSSPVGPLSAEINAEGALVSLGRARTEPSGKRALHATFELLISEMGRYFAGEPLSFTVPADAPGSDFQRRVWAELRRIPWGRTITYSELAARVGSNPRAVGQANGHNPVAIVVPCHRVIGKDGSLVGYAGGLDMKRALLRVERVLLL
jgi:methylated-DNA-[protein]-cysteine S-methyltransferase